MRSWTISYVGDATITLEFRARIDSVMNGRVLAIAEAIRSKDHLGVRDVIESYCAVTVEYDPLQTDVLSLVCHLEAQADVSVVGETEPREITIPVCYGGDFGPDLPAVAAFCDLSEAEVISIHGAATYRVFMLGFLPGFAYLGPLDQRISMPRRENPRLKVPQGSVAIAGRQTGVYPINAPGGWQLIGQTSIRLFDFERREPFLLRPGDHVQFETISKATFGRCVGET